MLSTVLGAVTMQKWARPHLTLASTKRASARVRVQRGWRCSGDPAHGSQVWILQHTKETCGQVQRTEKGAKRRAQPRTRRHWREIEDWEHSRRALGDDYEQSEIAILTFLLI